MTTRAQEVLQQTQHLADEWVRPQAERWQRERVMGLEAVHEAARLSLLGVQVPVALGGLGLPFSVRSGMAAACAGLSRSFFVASQVLVERLGSWLAAVAVNRAVALIRELAQMNFLTIRGYAGMRPGEIQRIEYFLVDAVVL